METFTLAPNGAGSSTLTQEESSGHFKAASICPSAWSEAELIEAIVAVCDESQSAPMVACWRVLEHCRRHLPRGTPESLRLAMRTKLRRDMGAGANDLLAAA